jgi:hypothetical protein
MLFYRWKHVSYVDVIGRRTARPLCDEAPDRIASEWPAIQLELLGFPE